MADEREDSVNGSGGMVVRVSELARELEVKPSVVLALLSQFGDTQPKTHSSSVSPEDARKIQEYVQSGGPLPAPKPVPPLTRTSTKEPPPTEIEEEEEQRLRLAAFAEAEHAKRLKDSIESIKRFSDLCSQELQNLPRRVPEEVRYAVTAYGVVSLHGMLDHLLYLIDPARRGETISKFEKRRPTLIEQMEALIELAGVAPWERAQAAFLDALGSAHETRKAIAHPTVYNKPSLKMLSDAFALLYVLLDLGAINPEDGHADLFPTTQKELSICCSRYLWDLWGAHSLRNKKMVTVVLP
jgi:hypothetical protein